MKNKESKITISMFCIFLILSATSSLATETVTWRTERPCGQRLPSFQPTEINDCDDAYCSAIPNGSRLCACLKSEETGELIISLEPKNAPKKEWTINVIPPISVGASFDADIFRLDSADLNGDGREELLFAVKEAEGQGMGVQHWRLRAINGEKVSDELQVEDYGVMSYITCSPKRKGAYLLASRWIWGREPGRGGGLYIAGQWYELGGGDLYAVPDWPSIYHRYLFSLSKERGKALGQPVLWHLKKDAHETIGPSPFK